MAAMTPKQQVEKQFGTRVDLIKAISPLIGADDDAKRRLAGTTNKKLLRIYASASDAQQRFGGKAGLIDAIASGQFPKGSPNPGWREKMEGFTVKRLLDLHRQYS